jgi:hypothetical protein
MAQTKKILIFLVVLVCHLNTLAKMALRKKIITSAMAVEFMCWQ